MPEKRLAFVVPWYGVEVVGGAETMVRRIAQGLAARGMEVEVLTTRSADSGSLDDLSFYPRGNSVANGVKVRRFEAVAPESRIIDDVLRRLRSLGSVPAEDELRFLRSLFNSPSLLEFAADCAAEYTYVYSPYWCGTTYLGTVANPQGSYIIPCLHDEPMAHLKAYREMFRKASGLLFYSKPEMDLALRLYDLDPARCAIIGGTIEPPIPAAPERFRAKYNVRDEFILVVGRKADNKNTPMLVNYFAQYKRKNGGSLKLVLIGPGKSDIPAGARGDILDLGILPETDKNDAYAAACVLCQPSVNESYSIVIMESWARGTPVLVHAGCDVTRTHCIDSNGGLFFRDYPEFEGCLDFLTTRPDSRSNMGASGRKYVEEQCRIEVVVERFTQAIYGKAVA